MKTLFNSTKISLIGASVLFSLSVFASPTAIVSSVSGNAFYMLNGQTKYLHQGDKIENNAQVITEVGSEITLMDYYDHKFHIAGSGHVKLNANTLGLERGYVWIQSYNPRESFYVKTSNSKVSYNDGEAVVSFDPNNGKTQVMTIKGEFNLANAIETQLNVPVMEGQFSFVTNDYESGMPRQPVSIGENSYHKVASLFDDVTPMNNLFPTAVTPKAPSRGIASVTEEPTGVKVISHPTTPVNMEVVKKSYDRELKKVAVMKERIDEQKSFHRKSAVKLTIFKPTVQEPSRLPASVPEVAPMESDPFEKTLQKAYDNQPRHSNEVNKLIEELKDYNQDYDLVY